ncbi:MAG: hypothetical protein KAR42_11005 [candidate division Zixibacteria bacterium]|nr:hypothetical protein [candidate division Zixibacteria bacterium]
MAVQGGNTIDHGRAYAGMVADMQLCNGVSKLNKSNTVTIPAGKGVVTDGEDGVKLPVAASAVAEFNGVVRYELNRVLDGSNNTVNTQRDMTVITHGVIWVTVLDTVAKDAPVYLRVGSTGNGDFSGVIGAGVTLGISLPHTKFLTGGTTGQLVKISLGLGG